MNLAWSIDDKYFFNHCFHEVLDEFLNKNEQYVLVTCNSLSDTHFVQGLKKKLKLINIITVPSNPSLEFIGKYDELNQDYTIIAIGGGSVIDFSKILYGLNNNSLCFVNKNLEINSSGKFKKITKYNKPLIIFPTTTGSGAEVTPFATIWDFKKNIKLSITVQNLISKVFYDFKIMKLQPFDLLVASLFDSLSHCLESLWSKSSNSYTEIMAQDALLTILKSLNKLSFNKVLDNEDYKKLCFSTFLSGKAISITKTALCHSMSYPVTLKYGINHGLAVGFFLPDVLIFNEKFIYQKLDSILSNFQLNNIYNLSHFIRNLFVSLNGYQLFINKINSLSNLNTLTHEMITNDRILNNVRNVKLDDLDLLVKNIIKNYGSL